MNARLARFLITAFLIAAALALSACGNKGPLVLPDDPEEATAPAGDTAPDAAAPADDTPDDADAPVVPPPEDD